MESGKVAVEARIDAILDYEVRKMNKSEIGRKYGVGEATVRGWMKNRDYFVNKCLEIAKIATEGKLNYFLGEEAMKKTEENHKDKENPKELAKKVKYLEQKLAYYEALAEVCGVDFDNASKKNDAKQLKEQQKKLAEN